jgi:hypothetical protein
VDRQVPDPQVISCSFILKNTLNIQVFDRSDLEGQNFPLHLIFSSTDTSWNIFSPSNLKNKTIINSTQNTKIFKYNTLIKINQHSEPGPLNCRKHTTVWTFLTCNNNKSVWYRLNRQIHLKGIIDTPTCMLFKLIIRKGNVTNFMFFALCIWI